jgi:hypothetical protein
MLSSQTVCLVENPLLLIIWILGQGDAAAKQPYLYRSSLCSLSEIETTRRPVERFSRAFCMLHPLKKVRKAMAAIR